MFSSKKSAEAKETVYDIGSVVFGKWRITKFIGRGSFGRVFQIDRIDGLLSESSALKVITIPPDGEELQSLRSGGMSTAQAKKYLEGMANDVVREVGIMSKLKGTTNIVSYEDCEKIPHENGIGWDILIRMELLNPLLRYACEHPFSRRDVAKLGIDICKALELCQKNNIVHRDVKPENIFVSENGDFKLGDFGISRTFEHTAAASTRVGTVNYMAPEVFNGERKYGFSVDTYSLGLVLYRLINKNRLPFLPPASEGFLPQDQEVALARRMAGEPVPSPYYFQGRLPEIVLRACAPDVEKRFSSPAEMRRALETIPDDPSDSLLIYPDGDTLKNLREIYFPDDTELIDSPAPPPPEPDPSPRSDKTARLFTEPESAPVPPPPEPNPSPKPERPKKPIGVFAAVGLCAVAAAVGLFMTLHSRNVTDAGEVSAPPSQSSAEPSPSVSSLPSPEIGRAYVVDRAYESGTYTGHWNDGKPNGNGTLVLENGEKYVGTFVNGKVTSKGAHYFPNGITYIGDFVDGVESGQGTATWPDGDKYVGDFADGLPNGQGTYYFADGRVYEGNFVDDMKCGRGTLTWPDGSKYEGEFAEDTMNGQGTYYFADGRKYVGDFVDGAKAGQGTFTWPDGDKYEGEFVDDTMNGQGTYYFADGGVYEGDFVDGTKSGQGTYTWLNGDKYVGEFADNTMNGQGTFYFADGRVYEGNFVDDMKNGQGTFTWPDGDKYEGEFVDDTMNGQGTYTWPNGDKYVGEFADNTKNGQGTYYFADGRVLSGTWVDDQFVG